MTAHAYSFGDRVRHVTRPEWGVGDVVRVERFTKDGEARVKLSIRFPSEGLKTLSVPPAPIEHCTNGAAEHHDAPAPRASGSDTDPQWDRIDQDGWLGEIAKKKTAEAITEIPQEARDPFRTLEQRLRFTLGLYRFSKQDRSLVAWAVAQTGMDDPLTRYSRPELEQFFDRWSYERDVQLKRLLDEARHEQGMVRKCVADAAPDAQRAVRRFNGGR